jgi:broad specificity phosphatase PhoE
MGRVVHLVRHGEVENPDRLFYGRLPGFSLSSEGTSQAHRSAGHLSRFSTNVELVTSPLERARETAEIVRGALGLERLRVDERLIEAGSWRDGLPRTFSPLAHLKRLLDGEARRQNENAFQIIDRMLAAIKDAAQNAEVSVLVSHQTPITLARVALERGYRGSPRAAFGRLSPWVYVRSTCDHASVTTLELEADGEHFRLASSDYFNPCGAAPPISR